MVWPPRYGSAAHVSIQAPDREEGDFVYTSLLNNGWLSRGNALIGDLEDYRPIFTQFPTYGWDAEIDRAKWLRTANNYHYPGITDGTGSRKIHIVEIEWPKAATKKIYKRPQPIFLKEVQIRSRPIGSQTWRSTIVKVPYNYDFSETLYGKSYIFTASENEAYQAQAIYYGGSLRNEWSRVYWSSEWPLSDQLLCTAVIETGFKEQGSGSHVGDEEYQLGIIVKRSDVESRHRVSGFMSRGSNASLAGLNQLPQFVDRNYLSCRSNYSGSYTNKCAWGGTTQVEPYELSL